MSVFDGQFGKYDVIIFEKEKILSCCGLNKNGYLLV